MTVFSMDRTRDPRTKDREAYSRTGGLFNWVVASEASEEEEIAQSSLDELSGGVEILMERPIKWTAQIRDLGEEGYMLLEPVQITIEEYRDESVIARFPEVEVFGEGYSESEAIANLKIAILDLYDELGEVGLENLGKEPHMWWRVLNRLVSKS